MWVLSIVALVTLITSQPIENFGLITVTHSRNGDFSVIEQYLQRYTETDCYTQLISQINIIWNNEESPEQTSVMARKKFWKIPVYFFKTTFNSMDHRYRLPKESTAQLLYSLDDDIIVDCETFQSTLKRFNEVNKHQLGAVTTNEVRGYAFDPNQKSQGVEFLYQGHAAALYFSIAEPGAAFIPRHFLQLYYLKLDQLVYMRNIVLDVKNCDDIFFWAIVQHFYPQLPGVYVKGQKNYKNTDPKVGQSKVKNVYPIRNNCINNISNALGYNSLRLFTKNSTKYLSQWQYPNLGLILSQKMAGLSGVQKIPAEEKQSSTPKKLQKDLKTVKVEPEQQKIQPPPTQKQQQAQSLDIPVQKASKVQQVKKQTPQKIEAKVEKEVKQVQTQAEKKEITNPKVEQIPKSQDSKIDKAVPKLEPEQNNFRWKLILLGIVVFILSIILYKLYKRHLHSSKMYAQRLSDIDEEQHMYASSIRLPDHY